MVGRREDQPARSYSKLAGQQEQADEAPSGGPAGSMQASAGRQAAPDASNAPASTQPKRAAVPAGPFAQLLGPLQPVLRASPGAVMAAALLLHGAIAARDPIGPGSGHLLAWPLTASFLRVLLTPASIQRLGTAARAYAAVAVAVAGALQRRQQQAQQQQALQQQAQQQQALQQHALQQQAQQQQQQALQQQAQQQQQGPAPMQVEHHAALPYSRPPQHQQPQQPQQQAHAAAQGLVGAAKRKSSKPRSTQEALGAAGGSARHAAPGSGAADGAKGGRRRRKQPERLQVALDAGPSYQPAPGRAPRRTGSGHRRSPSLADILLPPEPLPRWGRQRHRLDTRLSPQPTLASLGADASLDLEGGGGLSALGSLAARASDRDGERQALAAARQAGGPLVAENDRLRRELQSMQQQRAGLESRVRQLQQIAMAAGSSHGGRGRSSDSLERERLADAQAQLAVERRHLTAQRQAFERERQDFRRIVESLAQTVLPPGAAAVVAAARQAMAGSSASPALQPAAQPQQQAQRGQPAAAYGQSGRAATFQMSQGPALRPVQPVAMRGVPLPARPALRPQFGGQQQQPPPPLPTLPPALQGALQGLAARPPSSWQQPAGRPQLTQSLGVPSGIPLHGGFPGVQQARPAFSGPPGGLPPFPGQLLSAPAPAPPAPQPRPAAGSSVAAAAQQLMDVLQRQQAQQQAQQAQQQAGAGGKLQELASQLLTTLMQPQRAPQQQQQQQPVAGLRQLQPQPGQPPQPPQLPSLNSNVLRMLQDMLTSGRLGPEQLQQAAGLLAKLKQEAQGGAPQLVLPAAPQQQQQQQRLLQPAAAAPPTLQPAGSGGAALLQYLNTAAKQLSRPPPPQQQPALPTVPTVPAPVQPLVSGATLPPALEAQLALLPVQLREQMTKSLRKLCTDIQRGQTNVQQLVSTLALPPEAQQRVATMLQQMVQPPGPSNGGAQAAAARQPAGTAGLVVGLSANQAPGVQQQQQQAALGQLGSSGATPQVSPSAAAGLSAFAAASQRPLSASPVLQKVTADDVAPVHKQLPPIRTSSMTLADAARRAASQHQHLAAAAAAAAQQGRPAAQPAVQAQQAQQPPAQPAQQPQQPQAQQPQQPRHAQQPQPAAQQAAASQPTQQATPAQQATAAQPAQQVQADKAQPDQLAGGKRKAPEGDAAAASEALPNGGGVQHQEGPEEPAAKLPRTEAASGAADAGDGGPGPAS